MRSRSVSLIYISAFAAVAMLALSCRSAEVAWPAANDEDLAGVVYVTRPLEEGAGIIAVSAAGGVRDLGLRCDGQSDVTASPDGERLYYGLDSALHEYAPATKADRVVVSFDAGIAREPGHDDEGNPVIFAWHCGARFRDVRFSPQGEVAFVVEPTECPVSGDAAAGGEDGLTPRTNFAIDAGAYLLEPGGGEPRYLGPTRAVYGFAGGSLLLENKLTVARYDLAQGTVQPLLAADTHELGWLPWAAAHDDEVVVVANKAAEKSGEVVVSRIFVVRGGRGADEPVLEIEERSPATCGALSPDGRYLAVQCTPLVFGEPTLYVVDLEREQSKVLARGANLVGFARGSGAVYYVVATGRVGDLFLAGLDGAARRLSSSGDVLLPP
jgi:hypothetical protein